MYKLSKISKLSDVDVLVEEQLPINVASYINVSASGLGSTMSMVVSYGDDYARWHDIGKSFSQKTYISPGVYNVEVRALDSGNGNRLVLKKKFCALNFVH